MKPPKIQYIKALEHYRLLIIFENGEIRLFSLLSKLHQYPYSLLKEDDLFQNVRLDSGGYGISWNDDIDISENELWQNSSLLTTINEIAEKAPQIA